MKNGNIQALLDNKLGFLFFFGGGGRFWATVDCAQGLLLDSPLGPICSAGDGTRVSHKQDKHLSLVLSLQP